MTCIQPPTAAAAWGSAALRCGPACGDARPRHAAARAPAAAAAARPLYPLAPAPHLLQVARHNAADDLWLIIQDKRSQEWRVYDMTAYVDEHPGGMAIMYNAGGDATKGFHGPQHPPTVFDILGDYCIGTLIDP